jgi:hypothetical protein
MSYRITLSKPIPLNQTESKLNSLQAKSLITGIQNSFHIMISFLNWKKTFRKILLDLTIHGNSVADFRSL